MAMPPRPSSPSISYAGARAVERRDWSSESAAMLVKMTKRHVRCCDPGNLTSAPGVPLSYGATMIGVQVLRVSDADAGAIRVTMIGDYLMSRPTVLTLARTLCAAAALLVVPRFAHAQTRSDVIKGRV